MADEQDILTTAGLQALNKDIRLMSRKELVQHFAADKSGRVVVTKLIKNIIWQAYQKIKAGTEPPINGNLRSFWYLWVKPILARVPAYSEAKTDPYGVMLKMFTELIMDRHLCKYADFDFTDENWENRRIGTNRPNVLVFAEKAGWIRFLRELHDEFGVSILALGGAPSALTSEYTVRAISTTIDPSTAIVSLIGIVDYDPAGHIIAHAFQNQLADAGIPNTTLTITIDPKHYTDEELKLFRYPLPKGEKTKLAQWMAKTGGIDGKAYGLESESMPRERLRTLIRNLIL